jgi:hypothetical protein
MLEWNISRGYRRATGVAGLYMIHKNHQRPGYSLFYNPGDLHGGVTLGTEYTSYAKAERAADDHNHAIIDKWRTPVTTPAAVQEAASVILKWNGWIPEVGQPILQASRILADYVNGLVATPHHWW